MAECPAGCFQSYHKTGTPLARYALAGALPALWQVYFVDNLTQYSQNIRGGIYPMPLPNLLNNLTWSIPGVLGLIWLLASARKRWREALACAAGAVLLFIFTYAIGRRYAYYAIVMAAFGMLGFAALLAMIPQAVSGTRLFRRTAAVLTAVLIALSPLAARAWNSKSG